MALHLDRDGELVSSTDPAGRTTTHVVDGQGLRTRTIQPDGSVIDYAYTAAGDLERVTLPSGATERFFYDARGNLVKRLSPAGRATEYAYDAANRLVSERDGTGVVQRYEYDDADNLVKRTDGLDNVTAYTYDRNGHLLTETAADGGVTRYEWDAMFRVAKVTDPEGGVTEYRYNREDALVGMTDPVGAVSTFAVDPLGRAVSATDPLGGVWERELDLAGRAIGATDPLGRESRTAYDAAGRVAEATDPEGGRWEYAYDAVGNLTRQTDPLGGVTELEYDALDRVTRMTDPDGRAVEYVYDADGGLVAVVDPVGETTGFSLDADGLVLASTNALGETSEYAYDAAGRVSGVTDPLGARTAYAYDGAGRLEAVTDALGGVTRTEYDAVGRPSAQTDPDGHRTETRYDLAGRVVALVDGEGGVTAFGYDAAGRQTATTDADGRATRYEYDDAGQLVAVVEGYRPGAAAASDANVRTEYAYTAAGELASVTDPLGQVTAYAYDRAGRLIRTEDAAGAVTTAEYDLAGRVVGASNGDGQRLRIDYTPGGVVTGYAGPAGEVRFEHDGAGRPILMEDPQGVTAWRYDALGRVVSETNGRGETSEAAFDGAGRLASLTAPGGDAVEYGYDPAGRLVSQQTPWGDLAYTWTPGGALTGIARGDGVTTQLTVDGAGRVTRVRHGEPAAAPVQPEPAPEVVLPAKTPAVCPAAGAEGYLDRRVLQNLEGEDQQCVKTGAYLKRRTQPAATDPVGRGGALQYDYTYTAAGKVASAGRQVLEVPAPEVSAAPDPGGPGAGAPGSGAPDPGNTTPVAPEPVSSLLSEFDYDGLGRLAESRLMDLLPDPGDAPGTGGAGTGSTGTGTGTPPVPVKLASAAFAYDGAGNRVSAVATRQTATGASTRAQTQQYGAGNRLLETRTVEGGVETEREYRYDGAGRRIGMRGDRSADYVYDWGGQPTMVRDNTSVATTTYDGLGRAVSQQLETAYGGDSMSRSYFGSALLSTSSEAHGDSTVVWGALGRLAGIARSAADGADDEARWALLDSLGSVVAEATGAGGADISELVSYAEFGVPGFESSGFAQLHGYTGQLQDPGTGVVSFFSRDYDPDTATWLAPDAWPGLLTVPQSLNRYAYVLNDPVTLIDVGGFKPARPEPKPPKLQVPVRTVLNASALLNHYGKPASQGASWQSLFVQPGVAIGPSAASVHFLSVRHATGTRQLTSGSCSGGSTNRFVIQGCAGKQLDPVDPVLMRQFGNLLPTSLALTVAKTAGAECRTASNGLIVCRSQALNVQGGTTYGEVFITSSKISRVLSDEDLLAHEQRHSEQWASLGPVLFGASYLLEVVKSEMETGTYGCGNRYEIEAGLKEGNYQC